MSLQITLNGEKRELPDGTTLSELLDQLALSPDKVAIEWNRRLARREKLTSALSDGDEVEIVTFVGGGS